MKPRNRARSVEWTAPENCSPGERIARPRRFIRHGMSSHGLDWVALSPDGKTLAARDYTTIHFAPLDGNPGRSFPLGGPSFGVVSIDHSLAWDSGSRALWLLIGETLGSGHSAGPLACARLHLDGRMETMPPLQGLPGRLDQVAWVGDSGVGLAQIDTRGGYHRPEQADPEPGLAVIDASTGRVRSLLSGRDAILAPWGRRDASLSFQIRAMRLRPDGRVQALAFVASFKDTERRGAMMLWTEGQAPRLFDEGRLPKARLAAFTPDGRLLVIEGVMPGNVVFDVPNPPPLIPRTGPYAELWNPAAARRIWRLTGTASTLVDYAEPVVRPDGRQALVSVPETCGQHRLVALIDVQSGRVLQRHIRSANRTFTGFHDGRPWIASSSEIAFY